MIGASSGTGSPKPAQHEDEEDPEIAELENQVVRQARLPDALANGAAEPLGLPLKGTSRAPVLPDYVTYRRAIV